MRTISQRERKDPITIRGVNDENNSSKVLYESLFCLFCLISIV